MGMLATIDVTTVGSLNDLKIIASLVRKDVIRMPNISALARQLNKDRKTVRKYLNGFEKKTKRERVKYLDKYRCYILNYLKDEFKTFEYYDHLYLFVKDKHGIDCSYSTFKRYIQNDEELSKYFKKKKNGFTTRFETPPAKQAQFDLKEDLTLYNKYGEKIRVHIATLTLAYSRYNVRKIILDKSRETVLIFLAEALDILGGVIDELVIDNIKCLVDKPRTATQGAILNNEFVQFTTDYGITVKPCMPYRPQTKGKTETQNKVVGRLKNYSGEYIDIDDIIDRLEIINNEDNDKISGGTGFPASFLLPKEKEALKPLPPKIIRESYYLKTNEVNVSNESLISHKSCKYSVPKKYIGKRVSKLIKRNKLHIYYNKKLITVHEISNKKTNIKDCHELVYENYNGNIETKHEKKLQEMEMITYDNA